MPTISDQATQPRRTWRTWAEYGGNAIIILSMVGMIVYVPLIRSQNVSLRKQLLDTAAAASALEAQLRRTAQMGGLAGMTLPRDVAQRVRVARAAVSAPRMRGILVMVYTHGACERSVLDGLASLRDNPALKASGLPVGVIVGERGRGDREYAMRLREDGLLVFPTAFVPLESVTGAFFPRSDSTFAEEPIYLLLNENLTIRSAFHGDQRQPTLLDEWLVSLR